MSALSRCVCCCAREKIRADRVSSDWCSADSLMLRLLQLESMGHLPSCVGYDSWQWLASGRRSAADPSICKVDLRVPKPVASRCSSPSDRNNVERPEDPVSA